MARTALVTLCLGDSYIDLFERYCRPNWEWYAEAHGYDVVVLTEMLDSAPEARQRFLGWQKCLIFDALPQYDRLVWVDSDIVINPSAPCILKGVPPGKVGAVISGDYLHPDLKTVFTHRLRKTPLNPPDDLAVWEADQKAYYDRFGLHCVSPDIVQVGVMVLDRSHRDLFMEVYRMPLPARVEEQWPLSAEILNRGLLHRINSRFNTVFLDRAIVHYPYLYGAGIENLDQLARLAVQTEYANCHFLHFAGDKRFMPCLDEIVRGQAERRKKGA